MLGHDVTPLQVLPVYQTEQRHANTCFKQDGPGCKLDGVMECTGCEGVRVAQLIEFTNSNLKVVGSRLGCVISGKKKTSANL